MPIPRIIHQIYVGNPIPDKFLENMADWQLLNKGWKYMLWTQPLPDMLNIDLYSRADEFVKTDAIWQFASDLMRYEVLYRYGGFYCDTDTKPLRPLGDLLTGLTEFAVREDKAFIGNTYLATEPCTELFAALTERQREHAKNFTKAAAGVVSGPQYLTPIWQEFNGHVDERTPLWFPYSYKHVRACNERQIAIPEDAYAIHAWEHSLSRRRANNNRSRNDRKEL